MTRGCQTHLNLLEHTLRTANEVVAEVVRAKLP